MKTLPPFVLGIHGRGLKTLKVTPYGSAVVILRIDDLRNPEDWTEITLDGHLLEKWCKEHFLDEILGEGV